MTMPIPILLTIGAGIAALTGVVKGGKAISNNNRAKKLIEEATYNYNYTKTKMDEKKRIYFILPPEAGFIKSRYLVQRNCMVSSGFLRVQEC
jgi:hypothetical protein